MLSFSVIIPARYHSSRLHAKLLRTLGNKPVIEHTYLRACESGAERIIIATDDARIEKVCLDFGAEVCMTKDSHPSGTARIGEVIDKCKLKDEQIIVNLQGDEPVLQSMLITQVAKNLYTHKTAVATLCTPLRTVEEYRDNNVVKVVKNVNDRALYFSRSPVPYFCDMKIILQVCYRHIGIYAYQTSFLRTFLKYKMSILEKVESLEQLTMLYYGYDIHTYTSKICTGFGIDTKEDLEKLRATWQS